MNGRRRGKVAIRLLSGLVIASGLILLCCAVQIARRDFCGRVTLQGVPVPFARVILVPNTANGRVYVGDTLSDGRFYLKERRSGNTAIAPGRYHVVVSMSNLHSSIPVDLKEYYRGSSHGGPSVVIPAFTVSHAIHIDLADASPKFQVLQ